MYYCIADDAGNVDEAVEEAPLQFKGMSVKDLTSMLEEETGLSDLIVCTRNPLNAKQLRPLLLQLPPNNATMHVVLVKASSKGASSSCVPS